MVIIPGYAIQLFLFPGVIIHEFGHVLFCKLTRTPIIEVCYFQLKKPAGYVVHEKPNRLFKSLLIAIGPFIVSTIIGILILIPISLPNFEMGDFLEIIFLWLGVSILSQAFPSRGDLTTFNKEVENAKGQLFVKIISYPVLFFMLFGVIGSYVVVNFMYALMIVVTVPNILAGILK